MTGSAGRPPAGGGILMRFTTECQESRMRLQDFDTSRRLSARVASSTRITPADSETEIRHIDLAVDDFDFTYRVGQSIGVLVPGPHEFSEKQYLRLYHGAKQLDEALVSIVGSAEEYEQQKAMMIEEGRWAELLY
jgi:hypothetical protein